VSNEKKFAVLIDADNVSGKYAKLILDEVSNDGIATYKRIYGDWTKPSLASWKSVLLDYSVVPVQQYSYTTGKNATDSAMIIDAMDILYTAQVDGFVLISSDSDFTRLATRLREAGKKVYGMGEKRRPSPSLPAVTSSSTSKLSGTPPRRASPTPRRKPLHRTPAAETSPRKPFACWPPASRTLPTTRALATWAPWATC
jgi:uncharacterized LabA/DUF88 family protein